MEDPAKTPVGENRLTRIESKLDEVLKRLNEIHAAVFVKPQEAPHVVSSLPANEFWPVVKPVVEIEQSGLLFTGGETFHDFTQSVIDAKLALAMQSDGNGSKNN